MFTAKKLGDSINYQERRRTVTVQFSDGVTTFEKDFHFDTKMTELEMKKRVKIYLDDINYQAPVIADSDITVSDIPEETPEEIAKSTWQRKRNELSAVMQLVRDGVFDGTEKPITDLQAKVKATFKPEYLKQNF